jgi:DNA-binding protein HU-beta
MILQSRRFPRLARGSGAPACDVVTEVERRQGCQASASLRLYRRHRPRARVRAYWSRKPDAPANKPAARAVKAKTPAPVVMLKHIAAEIAEVHELPTTAESMLTDTVDRFAKHLVKGNKVRIVGLGIFQVKRREAGMGRNPQTGEAVKIKGNKKVTFRGGKELKEGLARGLRRRLVPLRRMSRCRGAAAHSAHRALWRG